MKMYEYMVNYAHPNGVGRIEITRNEPIKSYDDVVALDKFIKSVNKIEGLFVTDFKLLRVYEKQKKD